MTSKRIKGLSEQWSEYILCLLLHMVLPLLPLLMEYLFTKNISESSLSITTAIYSISIGLSSKNKAMFGYCILVGVLFSAIYGVAVSQTALEINISTFCFVALSTVFLFHAAERYNRHVVDCQSFLLFNDKQGDAI